MKYRHRHHHTHVVYDLMLSETDVNGLAVYSEMFEDQICYRLFRPMDMIEIEDDENSHELQG